MYHTNSNACHRGRKYPGNVFHRYVGQRERRTCCKNSSFPGPAISEQTATDARERTDHCIALSFWLFRVLLNAKQKWDGNNNRLLHCPWVHNGCMFMERLLIYYSLPFLLDGHSPCCHSAYNLTVFVGDCCTLTSAAHAARICIWNCLGLYDHVCLLPVCYSWRRLLQISWKITVYFFELWYDKGLYLNLIFTIVWSS